jgi:hypothetical protein
MKFTIRELNENDYETILLKWWKDWKWTAPPKDFLPQNGKGGFMVYDKKTPVCAGYIYVTNSKVGWCDWIISNFEYKDRKKRKEALAFLVQMLTHTLKLSKCKYGYALLKADSLIEIYEKNGYIKADTYNAEMMKLL